MRELISTQRAAVVSLILLLFSALNICCASAQDNVRVKVVELSQEAFREKVYDYTKGSNVWKYEGDTPCVVDFYATWCPPCRALRPRLEQLAKEYAGQIVVYSVDVDKAPDLSRAMNISSIPVVLMVPKKGTPTINVGALKYSQLADQVEELLLKKDK